MVKVEVFTSPMCPHCPAAKRVVDEVAKEIEGLEVVHINVMDHPEKAAELGIMAVPTVAINGEIKFVGAPTKDALLAELKK
ncbi:redox-active disulfide protein 1 [Methanococcus maripaludis C5]|uniref:Redox-active disulfide protein 1 n=1 Tax=Methanococcus maripaludis (strain C5 / ATCC BAA-1333) TaxID=402880 RepID=A4G0T6_METM5|nr:MJ0307 family thioredoxin [Methanococcus maripaludis]ABO36070.1 redox-active disulfide protein 1 [Methanococcus maripaludis C5]